MNNQIGTEIVETILANMSAQGLSVYEKHIVPSWYQVYLHQVDYEKLRVAFGEIRAQARAALKKELHTKNAKSGKSIWETIESFLLGRSHNSQAAPQRFT